MLCLKGPLAYMERVWDQESHCVTRDWARTAPCGAAAEDILVIVLLPWKPDPGLHLNLDNACE